MNIGLDTSVVLRLLTGEPEDQAGHAFTEIQQLIRRGNILVVSDLVVSEVYFALQHHYRVPKVNALSLLADFLNTSSIKTLGSAATVLTVPHLATKKPGFVDRLIHAEYLQTAKATLTFEKAAGRLPDVRVLGCN